MMADDGARATLNVVIELVRGAASITASVSHMSANALNTVMQSGRAGLSQSQAAGMDSGQINVSPRGPVDTMGPELTPQQMRSLTADFRRHGISMSAQQNPDGTTGLKIGGNDVQMLGQGLSDVGQRLRGTMGQGRGDRGIDLGGGQSTLPIGGHTSTRGPRLGNGTGMIGAGQVLAGITDRQQQLISMKPSGLDNPSRTHSRGAR